MGTGMAELVCGEWYLNNLEVGRDVLAAVMVMTSRILDRLGYPAYSSSRSKRTISDHCKAGLLVIKEWLDVSYRDLCGILPSMPGVMAAGGIRRPPEHSTLCKFAARFPAHILEAVLGETARMLCGPGTVVPVDATGYTESSASRHFVKRMKQMGAVVMTVKDYAKVNLAGASDRRRWCHASSVRPRLLT